MIEKAWVQVLNEDYQNIDKEVEKFHNLRQKLIHTKWGQSLRKRVIAVHDSAEFKQVAADFKEEAGWETHVAFRKSFVDFLHTVESEVDLSDLPEDFEDSFIYGQTLKMLNFFVDYLDGDLSGPYEEIIRQ